MCLFGKKKKEKWWEAGDDFSGTASGGGGGGGGGGVLHILIVGDGMDCLHFPPPRQSSSLFLCHRLAPLIRTRLPRPRSGTR